MLVTSLNYRKALNNYVNETFKRDKKDKNNRGESNVPQTQWKYCKYN